MSKDHLYKIGVEELNDDKLFKCKISINNVKEREGSRVTLAPVCLNGF
jgi:hypothetical protein